MTPASCVRAPDSSATAVREPLVETAKPWNRPLAMFAAASPTISWSGCTSSPRRAAKLDAVAIVSVSDTIVMPIAATNSGPTSARLVHGTAGVGTPAGSVPTVRTPSSASPSTAETMVVPTTATSTAGITRVTRGRIRRTARQPTPTASVAAWVSSRWDTKARQLLHESVGVGREAEQLGELTDDDRDREAVHVADLDLARQQIGDEAELRDAHRELHGADEQREHPGQRDGAVGPTPGEQRHQGREDQRRDRRVGAEHQDA